MEQIPPFLRPLPLLPYYLTQILSSWISSKTALPQFLSSPSLSPEEAPPLSLPFKSLQDQLQAASLDEETFHQALNEVIQERWQALSTGFLQYLTHPYQRPPPPATLLWTKGTTQVWDYAPEAPRQTPVVLLIPSLINRGYILDLSPRLSLIQFLKAQDLRPWLVDWAEPGPEEASFQVADYITQRLLPLLEEAARQQCTPVSLVGYCMGGVMALGTAFLASQQNPSLLKKMALLATPWDFHLPLGMEASSFLTQALSLWGPFQETFHKTLGDPFSWPSSLDLSPFLFPSQLLQLYFHQMISPQANLQKFFMLSEWSPDSEKMEDFIAVEEWVNDGVPLPAPAAWECFYGWAFENRLARHLWTLKGIPVTLESLSLPSLVVTAQKDRIVPPASSRPLAEGLPVSQSLSLDTGHVGLIIGKKAPETLWQPLVSWLKNEESHTQIAC